jgi:hypothetical protein
MTQDNLASAKAQARVLKTFLAERGIELSHGLALEGAARLSGHKNWATLVAAAAKEPSSPQASQASISAKFNDGPTRERVRAAVADALGNALDCVRSPVVEDWGDAAMSQEDFVPVASSDARVARIARAAIEAFAGDTLSEAEAVEVAPPVNREFEACKRAFWRVFCDDGDQLMHDLLSTLHCAALNSEKRTENAERLLQAKHGLCVVLNGPYDLLSCEELSVRVHAMAKGELDRMPF